MSDSTVQPRVLIVDDNAEAAETMQYFFEIQGYDARAVFNANDALEVTPLFRPHVIVSDVIMPRMNGLELAARIRRNSHSAEAYLIAISGWAGDSSKSEVISAGFDEYFQKPIVFDLFLKRIAEVIAARQPLAVLP